MKIKNCFYGQVRRIWQEKNIVCTDLPNDTSSIITKQELITWNNDTGMNPYHADFDDMIDVKKMSYGEMLYETQKYNAKFMTNRFKTVQTAAEFEELIRQDYKNVYTSTAKLLAAWWHMDHFLTQDDALDYDFICLRQTDSYIDDWVTAAGFEREIKEKNKIVLGRADHNIPVVYNLQYMNRRTIWPSANFIPSYAYLLNRPAIKILRGKLYQLALHEMDYYDALIGERGLLLDKPGIAMLRIAVKNNIESVSLGPLILNPEQVQRGPADENGNEQPPIDYSQLDRSGTVYTGQHKTR